MDATTPAHGNAARLRRLPAGARHVAHLPPTDRRWVARAWLHIVGARLGLLLHPVTRAPARARSLDRDRFSSHAARREAALQIGRAVEAAARLVPRTRCLPKALAAQALVRRQGLPSRLHVGFLRTSAGAVRGHAWLECEGEVVVGDHPQLRAFVPTMVFDV